MGDDTNRAIMAKLFLAERVAGRRPGADPFALFLASLTAGETQHPIAAWITRTRDRLDWDENILDMVARYFGIPQKPLWPHEGDNGYAAAAQDLERELGRPA